MEFKSYDVIFSLPFYVPVDAKDEEHAKEIAIETLRSCSDSALADIVLDGLKDSKIETKER